MSSTAMSWCDSCSTYRDRDRGDGTDSRNACPSCGGALSDSAPLSVQIEEERTVGQSAPWHFWIVVVALAAYLLWRLVDLVAWVLTKI